MATWLLSIGITLGQDNNPGTNSINSSLHPVMKNQFFLNIETAGLQLGYVWRVQKTNWGFGLGLGVGSFDIYTFDHKYVEGYGLEMFFRYQPKKFLQFDGGLEFLDGFEHEDGDKGAGFVGLKLTALAGYKYVFLGNAVRLGASKSEFGAIYSLVLRVVIPGKK